VIVVVCSECGSKIRARDDYAGRQTKCPKCKADLVVPVPDEHDELEEVVDDDNPPPARRTEQPVHTPREVTSRQSLAISAELKDRILRSLDNHIEPVQTTLGYRLAIVVVAALMVLLPIIYLALIGLIGYGVFWHLVHDVTMFEAKVKGKGAVLLVIAYLAPAIIGVVMVAFMLKPLFARRSSNDKPKTVSRKDEPFLFEFIDKLCDAVGSPRPKSILLDDDVNAAAGLISGVWNPFRHDLMLVIGLPLVAGLNLKEFAGVLAHEFGHFSQGAGMRLGRIINSVNLWFAFVVYQRDEWDYTLERWSKQVDIQIGWVIYAARGCVWLTRKILHGLMIVGHAVSCRLAREMEFDADRHNARLSGSDAFVQTSLRLPILVSARQWAMADLGESYRERRLVDDFFSLISYRAGKIPDEILKKLKEDQLANKTGWFDTHPCDADRIASVNREAARGLLNVDAPAAVLFADFEATCRAETRRFYEENLGDSVTASNLVPLEVLVARHKAAEQEDEAVGRVLYGIYNFLWTFPFPESLHPATDSPKEVVAQIQALRERITGYRARHVEAVKTLTENFNLRQHTNLAEALLEAKLTVGKDIFTPPMTNMNQVTQVRQQCLAVQDETFDALAPILQDLADRIVLPLQLLGVPEVAAKIPDADQLWDESQGLIECDVQLRASRTDLLRAYDRRELIRNIIGQLEAGGSQELLVPCLFTVAEHGATELKSLQKKLKPIDYPFDHVEQGLSVSKYLIDKIPPKDEFMAVEGVLTYAADEGLLISSRIVGRLCVIAETVETALGLPLGDPPPKSAPDES